MSSKSPEKAGESLPLADQVALELREDISGGPLVSGMPLVEA